MEARRRVREDEQRRQRRERRKRRMNERCYGV